MSLHPIYVVVTSCVTLIWGQNTHAWDN